MTEQVSKLRVEIDSRRERKKVKALTGELNKLTGAGDRTTAQMSILSRSLRAAGGAFAAVTAGVGVGEIVRDLASLEQINSRIGNITGDLAGSQLFLKSTAAELSAEYRILAEGYSKLLPLYKAGVISIQEAQEVTRGLANVQAATGASSADLGRSIFGLSQGLAAGTLRAEELNQVTEALPGLLQALDKAAGVAGGGFRKLVNDGKVTSDFFKTTLKKALLEYDGIAASLSGNIIQTFNRTKNAYLEAISAFNEPISGAAIDSADVLTRAFATIADNAEEITVAMQAAGIAVAANLGGSSLQAIGRYSTSLNDARLKTGYFLEAEKTAAVASKASALSKLESARATETFTALRLKEAQAQNASLTGLKRLTFSTTELAAAEKAAAAATTSRVAAEKAATAGTLRLDLATKRATISARAFAVAQTAGSGALALIGGPTGAAVLAGGALLYYSLKQTEGEKSARALAEAVDDLADSYFSNADAAKAAGDAQIKAAEQSLESLRSDIAAVQGQLTLNIFADFFNKRTVEEFRDEISGVYDEIDRVNRITGENLALAFKVEPYDNQAAADAAESFDLVGARAKAAKAILDDLYPEEKKLKQLEDQSKALAEALQIGAISTDEFAKAQRALDEQRAKIASIKKGAQEAEAEAKKMQQALESALPAEARRNTYLEQLDLLEKGLAQGGASASTFQRAIDELNKAFKVDNLEAAAEKVRDFTDAIERRVDSPFQSYSEDITLLNQAVSETPGKIEAIDRAFANLDFEARAEFTVVTGDTPEDIQRNYDIQKEALAQFHKERNVSEGLANEDRRALNASFADQVVADSIDLQRRVAELGGLSEGFKFNIDVQADKLELRRLFDGRADSQSEYEVAAQTLARNHQEQLNEIVRTGEFTREQFEQASYQSRLTGLKEKYSTELSVAQDFATAILDVRVSRRTRQANAASDVAQKDIDAYESAKKAFEKNGTEENRIALKLAEDRRNISVNAAKQAFEDQKEANISSAKLSAGVAIMNALATGPNFYVGLAQAAFATYRTRELIKGIKSQQYGGSGSGLSSGGGSGTSGGSTQTAQTQPQAQLQQSPGTVVIVAGNFRSEQEALHETGRHVQELVEKGAIQPEFAVNFDIPETVTRITE